MIVKIASFLKRLIGKQQAVPVHTHVHVPNCGDETIEIEEISIEPDIEVLEPIKTPTKKSKQRDYPKKELQQSEAKPVRTDYMEVVSVSGKKPTNRRRVGIKTSMTGITQSNMMLRDVRLLMEHPFLAISTNRKEPICYENKVGNDLVRVKISRHSEHFLASIYDWDIIIILSGKLQSSLHNVVDIPSKTITITRQEILKGLGKTSGGKQELNLEKSLTRLKSTLIETTVGNSEYRKGKTFSFIDSFEITERKDTCEFNITLSPWLFHLCCEKGNMLRVHPEYFMIKSGLKKSLYRLARKSVGNKEGKTWSFLIETLQEKTASELGLAEFTRRLKKIVELENDIPGYHMKFADDQRKVIFTCKNTTTKIK